MIVPRIAWRGMAWGLAFFWFRDGYESEGDTIETMPFPIEQKFVVAVASSAYSTSTNHKLFFLKRVKRVITNTNGKRRPRY
jgi:hypothetical protein